jgi:hypothetical protein
VLVQLSGFVVRGLEDRGATHCRFAGCDDGEVTTGEAEEDFPGGVVRLVCRRLSCSCRLTW